MESKLIGSALIRLSEIRSGSQYSFIWFPRSSCVAYALILLTRLVYELIPKSWFFSNAAYSPKWVCRWCFGSSLEARRRGRWRGCCRGGGGRGMWRGWSASDGCNTACKVLRCSFSRMCPEQSEWGNGKMEEFSDLVGWMARIYRICNEEKKKVKKKEEEEKG